ncbi:MAG: glycosyltransferase [bacterium]
MTTKNEEKNIENCLKSVLRQTYPRDKIEIIVVDNNSVDKTKEISLKYTEKVFDNGPERSAQRNYGVKQSQGDCFLYLDADMILSENVVADCVEHVLKREDVVGLYIPEIIMGKSFWCQSRRFERSFYNGTVIDCVRFVRKNKFLEVGGFDETMSGPEDWDLDKKLKKLGKVELIKTPIYHNEGEFNLKKYLDKKSYYIKSFDKYIEKWGKNDPDVRKQFGLWYRYFLVFVEDGKWKKLLVHPILTCGMFMLRFLVGVRFLMR